MTSKQVQFKAEKRVKAGKNVCKRMLLQGKIPAVYYGKGVPNQLLTIDERNLLKVIQADGGINAIFSLELEDQKLNAIIRELEQNPITGRVQHIDFIHINLNEKIKTHVPLRLVGNSPAVKVGGVLSQNVHSVHLRCLPLEIPAHIDVDISVLDKVHAVVKMSDIPGLKGLEVVDHKESVVVTILPPKVEEVEAAPAATAATTAEPEVITKGKKDEEKTETAKKEKE